jgi:hypothetical protein
MSAYDAQSLSGRFSHLFTNAASGYDKARFDKSI